MSPSPVDEKAIFNTARKITDPEARASYLSLACGEDEAARQRIHALLAIHIHEDSFLESPPPGIEPTQIRPVSEQPGDTIGPYKLLQQIGEMRDGVRPSCLAGMAAQVPFRMSVADHPFECSAQQLRIQVGDFAVASHQKGESEHAEGTSED